MRLFVETTSGNIWNNVNGFSRFTLQGTLGAAQPLEIQFGTADPTTGYFVPALISGAAGIIFGSKQGRYDGGFVMSCSVFTAPGDPSGFYTGTLSFNTDPLQTALNTGASPDTTASVSLITEVDWIPLGKVLPAKSNPVSLVVNNTVITGNEGAITPANPGFPTWNQVAPFRPDITALTGGGTSLDAFPTAGGVAPLGVIIPNVRPAPIMWQLVQSPSIVATTIAGDTVIQTNIPHGLSVGQTTTIGGDTSTPPLNGAQVVTAVIDSTHFKIGVAVTGAGAGGKVTPAAVAGSIVRPTDFDAAANAVTWQSVF